MISFPVSQDRQARLWYHNTISQVLNQKKGD